MRDHSSGLDDVMADVIHFPDVSGLSIAKEEGFELVRFSAGPECKVDGFGQRPGWLDTCVTTSW